VNGSLLAEGNISSLARQLFSGNLFRVVAKIAATEPEIPGAATDNISAENLIEALKKIKGVENVTWNDNKVNIACSRDITPEIARVIVNSGAGLSSLNKKEYGLDEIYYRYFE